MMGVRYNAMTHLILDTSKSYIIYFMAFAEEILLYQIRRNNENRVYKSDQVYKLNVYVVLKINQIYLFVQFYVNINRFMTIAIG